MSKSAKVVLALVSAAKEHARTLKAQNNTLRGLHDQTLACLESLKKRFAA